MDTSSISDSRGVPYEKVCAVPGFVLFAATALVANVTLCGLRSLAGDVTSRAEHLENILRLVGRENKGRRSQGR